ncbi:hypothetical protein RDV78_03745 [Bacillota bacterium LX-D]|nr:hypothetical protein [Bacillota bacterium LX-D]
MSFRQFLFYQGVTFILFYFAGTLTAGGQSFLSNQAMNFLTFFGIAWVIAYQKPNLKYALPNVLATTLAFNTVTYLFAYAYSQPFPKWNYIALDYIMVIIYSILGAILAWRMRQQPTKER